MLKIADLKLKRNLKEYFMKLRFYSEISKSASMMTELEEYIPEDDMIGLVTSKLDIDDRVYGKYSKIFNDRGTKEVCPLVNITMVVHDSEVSNALNFSPLRRPCLGIISRSIQRNFPPEG
jgi:hypothetical protein